MDDATNRAPVLFLSGAGLPGWIWDDVRGRLPRASAVGARPGEVPAESLSDHARLVLEAAEDPWFVVVAHSVAGAIAAAMVREAPDRVLGVLGVAAAVPPPGRSFVGTLPFPSNLVIGAVTRVLGTRPPEKAIRSGLTGALEARVADRIVRDFRPAPRWLYVDRVPERRFPTTCGYLATSADRELSRRIQGASARRLGATWSRTLPTGHLPMLEDPDATTSAVDDFCTLHDG